MLKRLLFITTIAAGAMLGGAHAAIIKQTTSPATFSAPGQILEMSIRFENLNWPVRTAQISTLRRNESGGWDTIFPYTCDLSGGDIPAGGSLTCSRSYTVSADDVARGFTVEEYIELSTTFPASPGNLEASSGNSATYKAATQPETPAPPVATNGDFFVTAGQSIDIDVADLVNGDFAFTDFSMLPPSKGTLSNVDGSRVRYTANPDAVGNDQFGFFVISDAPDFFTGSGTIRISIQPGVSPTDPENPQPVNCSASADGSKYIFRFKGRVC